MQDGEIKVTVAPSEGNIKEKFRVYWNIKINKPATYKIYFALNGVKINVVPDETGIFYMAGQRASGYFDITTDKLGDNVVEASLLEYIESGRIGIGRWNVVDTDTAKFKAIIGEPEKTCTKEDFRNGMINEMRRSSKLLGWYDRYSPIIDVTDRVKNVYPDVVEARLTIFGNDLKKISVVGPYLERPPDRSDDEIVRGWELGYEYHRQFCPKDGKHYWVIYPCRLEMSRSSEGGGSGGSGSGGGSGGSSGSGGTTVENLFNKIPTWLLIVIILLFGGLILGRRGGE